MTLSKNGHLDKPTINRFYYSSEDYDEFGAMLKVADVEVKILEHGTFRGYIELISTKHLTIGFFETNKKVLKLGTARNGYITFTIWEPEKLFSWRKHEMNKGMIGILWNRENHSVTESNFKSLPISIEENFFENECRIRGYPELTEKLRKNEILNVPERQLNEIRKLVRYVTQNKNLHDSLVLDISENKIIDLLIDCLKSALPEKIQFDLHYQKFSGLIDFINVNLSDLTTVGQICDNTKIPERTIRRFFQKKYDISPKNYLNKLRLNEVRKSILKDSDHSNIMQVASEFNFWHMGQFSRDYKKLFGELPSETIKQSYV